MFAAPAHEEWEPLLTSAGYTLAVFDGINRFCVTDVSLVDELSYPVTPLDNCIPAEAGRATEAEAQLAGELAAIKRSRAYRLARWMRRRRPF